MNRTRLVFGTYDVPEPALLDRFLAGGGRRWTSRTCTATVSPRAP